MGKELLPKLFKRLESASPCIYFSAVLLQRMKTQLNRALLETLNGKCQKEASLDGSDTLLSFMYLVPFQ